MTPSHKSQTDEPAQEPATRPVSLQTSGQTQDESSPISVVRIVLTLPWDKAMIRDVLAAFLVTRLMVLMVIYISSAMVPMAQGLYQYASPTNIVVDGLVRFDSWWYHNIVTQGYNMGNIETGVQGNVAFFPLYPMLVKITSAVTGNVFVAGILVSNIALLIMLFYLYRLTTEEFDRATAGRAVFYLAGAPAGVFLSAMYTESTYLLFVVMTFYYARRSRWFWAGVSGFLASATRNTGILMAGVIALEGMHQSGFRFLPPSWSLTRLKDHLLRQVRLIFVDWRSLAAACMVPMGLISYMIYLQIAHGDALGFIHVQATWGRQVSTSGLAQLLPTTIRDLNIGADPLSGQINTIALMATLATVVFLPILVPLAFKMRPAHVAFVGLTMLIPLTTGTTGSMDRYILMLIPSFMMLAYWGRRPWVDRIVVGISLPLLAYSAFLFSHWYFAG